MKKLFIIIGIIAGAALVAAGSFWAGMTYQSNQANRISQEFMAARGLPMGGQMPGEMPSMREQFQGDAAIFPGRGTAGQIKSIAGDTLTLSTAQDVTTVNLSDETQIEMTVSGEITDLQTGMRVMVTGEQGEDGVIHASQITILSENPGGMPFDQQPPNPPAAETEP